MCIRSALLFSEFVIDDLFLIPTDSHLIPRLIMGGGLALKSQNFHPVLLI